MRGIMYELSTDPKLLGNLTADEFACTDKGRSFADWYEDTNKDVASETLQWRLEGFGILHGEENGITYIEFTQESKESYFAEQYTRFMDAVKELSIQTFASETMNTIQTLIEDTYDDAVYLAEGEYPMSFDQFVRSAELGVRYYIGNAIDMH